MSASDPPHQMLRMSCFSEVLSIGDRAAALKSRVAPGCLSGPAASAQVRSSTRAR